MNIGEAIARLQAKARELPTGYDTELRVSMCDGEGIEATRLIEIDHFAEFARDSGDVTGYYAIVQGHPHADEQVLRAKGVAHRADEQLQRWAEDGEPGGEQRP